MKQKVHSKISLLELYRGITLFQKLKTNLVREEKGDLLADPHSSLNKWKNYFCQLFHIHGVNDVTQPEIHMAQTLLPEPSVLEFKIFVYDLSKFKLPYNVFRQN
jgi:hypothetical protein